MDGDAHAAPFSMTLDPHPVISARIQDRMMVSVLVNRLQGLLHLLLLLDLILVT